jgi:hypothetical protein
MIAFLWNSSPRLPFCHSKCWKAVKNGFLTYVRLPILGGTSVCRHVSERPTIAHATIPSIPCHRANVAVLVVCLNTTSKLASVFAFISRSALISQANGLKQKILKNISHFTKAKQIVIKDYLFVWGEQLLFANPMRFQNSRL